MRLRNIFSHRNKTLLRELVATDFKLRYQGSALGYLWSLVRPLFLFGILLFVFGYIARFGQDIPHFKVYLLLGIVLWNFFVEATNNGLQSIVGRGDLIRKINFPKYIIVISGTISALINFGISLVVVGIFMYFDGVELRSVILFLPLLILELYALALALAFFLGALYVKFRDIGYIWELVLQAGFYATPIVYDFGKMVATPHPTLAKVMLLNPMAQIIQDARYIMVTDKSVTLWTLASNPFVMIIPIIIVGLLVVLAGSYFRRSSRHFAEEV